MDINLCTKLMETFFENIEELGAGQCLEIKEGNFTEKYKYWSPVFEEENDMNFQEAVDGAREKTYTLC